MRKYSRIAKRSVHLDMKKMIDLFAANSSTSEELFGEYVHLLFSNLSKDVSLEEFLRFFSSNFFLNGESQQILRVLDKITVLFYNHQPSHNKILRTSDSTYTFANAIILLNCDLHNPQN
jgi:Sec7-like guanine-nucleotide exchange factor